MLTTIIFLLLGTMENKNKGGKREGAGRPRKENKAYLIRCLPNQIKTIREFIKSLQITKK